VVLCLAALLLTGCSTWKMDKQHLLPWHKDEPQTPAKVVAMWSNTVLNQADRPSTRGFGGRLMFYAGREDKPVKVEGTLVVYGFDETHRKKDDPRPDRKFVFTKEQFASHYSKSDIGHSYSVWLPWDDAMGAPCKVSLIVRFIPKDGAVVVGEQASMMLPGPGQETAKTETEGGSEVQRATGTTSAGRSSGVRQISYEAELPRPLAGATANESFGTQVRTTTIPLPVQSRLARGASQATVPVRTAPNVAVPAVDSASLVAPQAAAPAVPRSGRFTLPRTRPLGDPIPLPRADRAGWPLPVAAARPAAEPPAVSQ
jgi:hypothetical protein